MGSRLDDLNRWVDLLRMVSRGVSRLVHGNSRADYSGECGCCRGAEGYGETGCGCSRCIVRLL